MDPLCKVSVIKQTDEPQTLMYSAMHQCYSEGLVSEQPRSLSESRYGDLCVKHLLQGNRGHYNPLEAPQISLSVGYFPHSTINQLRTHRTGVSFSVQSFRYTGDRISELGNLGTQYNNSTDFDPSDFLYSEIEKVFYVRPLGAYTDRSGNRYQVTEDHRKDDLHDCLLAAAKYQDRIIDRGYSEEHARSLIPFDVRQHFVMSCNLRSLLHILDLRSKKDAQLEVQQFCELTIPHLRSWVPEIWQWYEDNRYGKARLSP